MKIYKRNINGQFIKGVRIPWAMTLVIAGIIFGIIYSVVVARPLNIPKPPEAPTIPYTIKCGPFRTGYACNDPEALKRYIEAYRMPIRTNTSPVTAYTSRVAETDASPCIAADGSDICKRHANGEQVCASNDYPLHSLIHIQGFGDCRIADRMNPRYTGSGRVDIYFGYDLKAARNFGIKKLAISKL